MREGITVLDVDPTRFTETSAISVLEALPNLLRDEPARGAHVVFEIRLSGEGGGVWSIEISDGRCEIRPEFAEGADVRYTASTRNWCAVALGILDAKEAVVRAGHERLRPIFITSATTVLGLLPLALGLGAGAELRQPLAVTVIGGLVVATFLTLQVIPSGYLLVVPRRRKEEQA